MRAMYNSGTAHQVTEWKGPTTDEIRQRLTALRNDVPDAHSLGDEHRAGPIAALRWVLGEITALP